jgi:hypothetical protein
VLYHALCGRTPAGSAPPEMWNRPRRVRAGVPAPLEAAILAAATGSCSAADLRFALESIDHDDDAVPLIDAQSTPPEGVAPIEGGRLWAWLPVAVVAILTVIVVVVVAALMSGDNPPVSGPGNAAQDALTTPLEIAGVELFDPEGDGDEHTDEVALVADGDPASTWSTHEYRGAGFAGLKEGVGLVLRLDDDTSLAQLRVSSPTRGWSAMVFVGDGRETALQGWGQPAATVQSAGGDVSFDLGGRSGSAVLLWLTDPGAAGQAVIAEVRLAR